MKQTTTASQKFGHGSDFVEQASDDQKQCILNDPQDTLKQDQRNGPIEAKNTLISNQSLGPVGRIVDTNPDICSAKTDSEILQLIWKRHQLKAAKLLKKLKNIPSITWDSKGVVTLNGVVLEKSNIIDFLEVVFYSGKSKEVKYLSAWVAFLKNNDLYQFVINPTILIADYKEDWFFLGRVE